VEQVNLMPISAEIDRSDVRKHFFLKKDAKTFPRARALLQWRRE